MNNNVLFFSEKITPRLRYTVASIVGNLLGVNFIFTQDKDVFISSDLPKINYSTSKITDNELIIKPHDLLFENTIKPYFIDSEKAFFTNKINVNNELLTNFNSELLINFNDELINVSSKSTINSTIKNELNAHLSNSKNINYTFNFDVFARIFYLISRYEEYNLAPSVLDAHGRFSATKSVATRLDFLQQPIVNQYVIALSKELKKRFPNLEISLTTYCFQPTFDIDTTWLYRNKGFVRNSFGLIKNIFRGQLNTIKKRVKILTKTIEDPYFNFDYIRKLHQQYGLKPVVFWLLGDFAKYDINISWNNAQLQALIQSFAADFKVGIHPSYRSNANVFILEKEVKRLQKILNIEPIQSPKLAQNAQYTEGSLFPSRQHFLKLNFPETYRNLIGVGISEDWTMGYADETGFRASIATAFPWFDLEKNEETALIIHSFQAMDVTLNHYLHLTPEAAAERLRTLIETTKAVGGTFTTLWHNDNLAEMDAWKGWKTVYETLLKDAT